MPPTLGGKSLVTSRWVTGRRRRPGRRRPSSPGRPPGVLGEHAGRRPDSQRRRARPVAGSCAVPHVAQGHQRIAPQVAGVAVGDVPAAVGRQQLLVGGLEQVEQVHPGLGCRRSGGGGGSRRSATRLIGTDLLALVAPVDPVPQRPPVLLGERTRGLHQPGQAPTGVEHPGGHQGPGRAGGQAAGAAPAPLGVAVGAPAGAVGRRGASVTTEPRTEPRTEPGQQEQRVLPEPAEPGPMGGGPVDQGVVVADHRGPPAPVPQGVGDRRQRLAQGGVVVAPGVPGHPAGRAAGAAAPERLADRGAPRWR